MPAKSERVPLLTPLSKTEARQIQAFKDRFSELWANYQDIKEGGLQLSGNFHLSDRAQVDTQSILGVSKFRLKGFFVDYRHFSNKEPANFLSIVNLLRRKSDHHGVLEAVAAQKASWHDAGMLRN